MTRRELEITDINEIVKILEKARVVHMGLVDDGMPYIVPMNYGFTMEEGKLTLYLHSAVKGYKIDVIKKNPICCFELECDVEPFEGKIACQYGMAYSSVMGRGEIHIINEPEEKQRLMSLFMNSQTGRDFSFTEKQVSAVCVLRVDVSEYTAKRRPTPKERHDMMTKEKAE